jgi:pimeloyl-ACP methyl ester carboxylesterase
MTKHRLIPALIVALLLVLLAAPAGPVAAQDTPGAFIPAPCMFEGIELGPTTLDGAALGFECGYVVVPLRHAEPDGATIRLPVAVRRAAAGAPDPLLLAQGGPGGDAFKVFSILVQPTGDLSTSRDIVIFNQRGTPYAEPELTCPETDAALADILAADSEEGERLYNEAMAACYDRLLAEGIDLSAFNSLENAADVPLIARALGYDEYNFYGVSYGTLLGLHLMRNHPEGLRSVILDSVVPPDVNFLSEIAASEDRVFGEVFAACAADPACAAAYPNLEARFYALVAQYDQLPVDMTLTDPETGQSYDTYLDGRGLRSVLYQLLYVPRMAAVLPSVIADIEAGDLRYLEAMWPLLVFDQLVAEGMYNSVICAEDADIDVAAVPLDGVRPEIAATAVDSLQSILDGCARWQVEPLPPSVDDPVVSDIPTLLLSGRFDPVTPPAFAAVAAVGLSNATNLVDPTAAHGVAFQNDCINGIILDFLADPSAPPDSSCLAAAEPLDFVPPDAVTLPLLADVNQLRPRVLVAFGVAAVLLLVVLSPFLLWPIVYLVRVFGDKPEARAAADRRVRWLGRGLLLAFGALALVFGVGLLGFVVAAVADLTLATALALPGAAAPLLWLPIILLALAVAAVVALVLMWRRPGSGSLPGKVYHTIVAVCAVVLVVLIATQGLLLPRL